MPGMDGMATARALREAGAGASMVLLVTGQPPRGLREQAGAVGIRELLVKPLSPSVLFDATMQALGPSAAGARREVAAGGVGGQAPGAAPGARILVVEDNEINQIVARKMLERAGFAVDVVGNGELAVAQVQQTRYDLVFMDLQMPVMDGIAATVAIRKFAPLDQLPIIAMTANAMEQDRRWCMAAGMNDFVSKPIDPRQLAAVLARVLHAHD